MSEPNPSTRHRRANPPTSPSLIRRWKRRTKPPANKILPRSPSKPILSTVRSTSDGVKSNLKDEKPALIIIPTFYSCSDVFTPCLTPLDSSEEKKKVVMSVTVEGSVGPVKALIRLGASVQETIMKVLERYEMERRSPRLDPVETDSFQLHHSCFALQSLNKRDKIGEVGGRSFYLRRNSELNDSDFGMGKICRTKEGEFGRALNNLKIPIVNQTQFFVSFVVKKFNKIKRRTRRLWKLLTCNDRH